MRKVSKTSSIVKKSGMMERAVEDVRKEQKELFDELHEKLEIPKSFFIFGQEITVQFNDTLERNYQAVGLCHWKKNLIELQTPNEDLANDQVRQTFWHEALHQVLALCGYDKESKDEQFVELLSNCIYQIISSSNFQDFEEVQEDKKTTIA
jgi:hypothetical protein